MGILELRILPPIAIGRLGASTTPLEAYELEVDAERPLDFRRIVPRTSFQVDPATGEITRDYVPDNIVFKDSDRTIRPVAPFLEVFARLAAAPDELVSLTLDVLRDEGLTPADIRWSVAVGNIKMYRRTGDLKDRIYANVDVISDHRRSPLRGTCDNFLEDRHLPLGFVQYIKPTRRYPQIRFRFTPAAGLVYGADTHRLKSPGHMVDDPVINSDDLVLYDDKKGTWRRYKESKGPTLTIPGSIFAGYTDGDSQASWGYFDDECDGYVRVSINQPDGKLVSAQCIIGAGPPVFAPDTLPIRVVSDELEQILFGVSVDRNAVSLDDAEELVRRALETVRLMNTAAMNGNAFNGRLDVVSTMIRQDSTDFSRYYEPAAATSLVDNLALRSLHERVFGALAAGGAAWFSQALRKPEEVGDLTSQARRKMPALMRGADGRNLTLTRRQIDTVAKAAALAVFGPPPEQQKEGRK